MRYTYIIISIMSIKSKDYDYLIKILMVGDSGTGKSNILIRYTEDKFFPSFIATIGIDFKLKYVHSNNKKIKLQIWDTAGQERFRTITTAYYRGAMGIMLVYDVTDINSYNNVKYWINNIKKHCSENVSLIIVGNKIDIENSRVVTFEQGEMLANICPIKGTKFFETSAKNNINITESFQYLVDSVVNNIQTNEETFDNPVIIKSSKKKKSCC